MPIKNKCVDCKHALPAMSRQGVEWFCAHPQAERTNVYGAIQPCSGFRLAKSPFCGAQGTHFVSKLADRVLDVAE